MENTYITPNITTELFLEETHLNLLPQSIFPWFLQSRPLLVLLLAYKSSSFGISSDSLNRASLQEHGLCYFPFFLHVLSWPFYCNLKASKNYFANDSQILGTGNFPTAYHISPFKCQHPEVTAQTKLTFLLRSVLSSCSLFLHLMTTPSYFP